MPSNRTSNDIDLIQLTQYNILPNQVAKKPPTEPQELPDFNNHGTLNLPPTLNQNNPFAIFSYSLLVRSWISWTNNKQSCNVLATRPRHSTNRAIQITRFPIK